MLAMPRGRGAEMTNPTTDRLYSVIGVIDGVGAGYPLRERVRYSAYGSARHVPRGDINGDGAVNGADGSLFPIGATYTGTPPPHYTPDADLDFDGTVTWAEFTYFLSNLGTPGLPEGDLSFQTVNNTIGYAGYHFDPATGMSLARHRWLEHDLGRWMTRDPISYWGGSNLYEYALGTPLTFVDPEGLRSNPVKDHLYSKPGCVTSSTSFILKGKSLGAGVGFVPHLDYRSRVYIEHRACKIECCRDGQSSFRISDEFSIRVDALIEIGATIGARFQGGTKVPFIGYVGVSAYAGADLSGVLDVEGAGGFRRLSECGGRLSDNPDRQISICGQGFVGLQAKFGVMATVEFGRWVYESGIEGIARMGAFASLCLACDTSGCSIDMSRTTFRPDGTVYLQGRVCVGFGCITVNTTYNLL